MLAEIKRGLQILANGAVSVMRGDSTGAGVFAQAHGEWSDASGNGKVMIASTGVTGVAPGTAFSTTPPIALWNPPGSGVNLSILKAVMGYVSGTLGLGEVYWGLVAGQGSVPSGGTELTPVNALVSAPRGMGRVWQGGTLASTIALVRPAFLVPPYAGTALTPMANIFDEVRGELTIPPGTALALQEVGAAGTSPLVTFGLTWEEIPL